MKTLTLRIFLACITALSFVSIQSCNESTMPANPNSNNLSNLFSAMPSNLSFDEQVALVDTVGVRAMILLSSRFHDSYIVTEGSRVPYEERLHEEIILDFFDSTFDWTEINNPKWEGESIPLLFPGAAAKRYSLIAFSGERYQPHSRTIFAPGGQGVFSMDASAHYPAVTLPIDLHSRITPLSFKADDTLSSQQSFTLEWAGGIPVNQGFLRVALSLSDVELTNRPPFTNIYSGLNNTQSITIPANVMSSYAGAEIHIEIELNVTNTVTLSNGKRVIIWESQEYSYSVYVQ